MFKIEVGRTYKGRLVVQEFWPIPAVDCGGTFAPMCRLAIAAELDYEVHMLDVQTAFLNANVEEDVFVKVARGYESVSTIGAGRGYDDSVPGKVIKTPPSEYRTK